MQYQQREHLISRIVSGYVICHVNNTEYLIGYPSRLDRYRANELYNDILEEYKNEEILTKDEILYWMLDKELWKQEYDQELETLEKNIETLKVKLFELSFRTNERALTRKYLETSKNRLEELLSLKHSYDYVTLEGLALSAKNKYLFGCSIKDFDFKLDKHDILLDRILEQFYKQKIPDNIFRELARTDPWVAIWSTSKKGQLFDIPAIDFTDDQKVLIIWTKIYEDAKENPDCPHESIIADDDMFDGWLIIQRRKYEKSKYKKDGDELIKNEKIRNAEEVYIVANTQEDADKINEMNDVVANSIKNKRINLLKTKGVVNELDMPDTKQKLQMAIAQKFKGIAGGK